MNNKLANTGHYLPAPRPLLGRCLNSLGITLARCFWQLEYIGQANLPQQGAFVLAANHQSYADGLWVFKGLSARQYAATCAMVGADLASDHGLMGKIIMRCARAIPVGRHGQNPVRGLIMAKNAVEAGNNILIHPEGTRSRTGRLGKIQNGAAYIACKTQVPLIPVYISGAFAAWPPQAKYPKRYQEGSKRPQRITVEFGTALHPADYGDAHQLNASLEAWLRAKEAIYLAAESGSLAGTVAASDSLTDSTNSTDSSGSAN